MQTISDLGERGLIERIRQRVPHTHPDLILGIGDDAAIIRPARNRVQVVTTDCLVDAIHFRREWSTPREIGAKAMAVNLSDLGAMGAEPAYVTLSLALPPAFPLADFDELIDGVAEVARDAMVAVAGGNLTATTGPLTINVTALGWAHPRKLLRRDAARPGDDLYVTGSLGSAAAGLAWLQRNGRPADGTSEAPVVRKACRPSPPLRAGLLLARAGASSAGIDLSDGLSAALAQMASASGCGVTLDAAAIPIEPAVRAMVEAWGGDALSYALEGDDYELLFAVSPRARGRLRSVTGTLRTPITRIGKMTDTPGVTVEGAPAGSRLAGVGFEHFKEYPGTGSPDFRRQG